MLQACATLHGWRQYRLAPVPEPQYVAGNFPQPNYSEMIVVLPTPVQREAPLHGDTALESGRGRVEAHHQAVTGRLHEGSRVTLCLTAEHRRSVATENLGRWPGNRETGGQLGAEVDQPALGLPPIPDVRLEVDAALVVADWPSVHAPADQDLVLHGTHAPYLLLWLPIHPP